MEIKLRSLKLIAKGVDVIFGEGFFREIIKGNLRDWVINLYDVKTQADCEPGDSLLIEFEDVDGHRFSGTVIAELIDEAAECCILVGNGQLDRIKEPNG